MSASIQDASSGSGGEAPPPLAEINVTPLVDVMLVLLVIFMIASSAQSFEMEQQFNRLRQEQAAVDLQETDQLVEIDLPRATSKQVNLAEAKKVVLSFTDSYAFHIGPTAVLDCADEVKRWPKKLKDGEKGDVLFRQCVKPLVKKLVANEKIKEDKELYLRADRSLPYGRVLYLMARVRESGIHKFGLIAEQTGP